MNVLDRFTLAGFTVEFRYNQVSVLHPMHGRFLVCYKRAGEWAYEDELNGAYNALHERGCICDSPSSTKGSNPLLKFFKRKKKEKV